MSRFVVGIDLGTTNCAVAYVDSTAEPEIRTFEIRQITAPGEVDARATLPSFLLLPSEHEVAPAAMTLPWSEIPPRYTVGVLARDRGADLPHRQVGSAKSWLSYSGVDRTAAILPWRGDDEKEGIRVSPVEASARYLTHIREAWNDTFEDDPLDEQDVFLTVPASFDAVARELTVAAAEQAGLERITLLEEPQAAFYAWLARHGKGWRDRLSIGDHVLVCDVGGGTTDFSVIAVTDDGDGNMKLERIAVGDHILLGGDNMDLALAHLARTRLPGAKLTNMQFRSLIHGCRLAKETLLADPSIDEFPITVLGSGSKLIGGSQKTVISQSDISEIILGGFFPDVDGDARPRKQRALGLRELGLPYATDPAVSKHLADFLGRQERMPTAILWNGGVMKSPRLRQQVAATLGGWMDNGDPPRSLDNDQLDLAVAHGATYYGLVCRGRGIRIHGGTARSYYIGVESAMPAIPGFSPPVKGLCVAPAGMEPGTTVSVESDELGLTVGEATTFRFFATTTRSEDLVGTVIDPEETSLQELADVEANLEPGDDYQRGDIVPVMLSANITEVGTLELWCRALNADQRWKLEYSFREGEPK